MMSLSVTVLQSFAGKPAGHREFGGGKQLKGIRSNEEIVFS